MKLVISLWRLFQQVDTKIGVLKENDDGDSSITQNDIKVDEDSPKRRGDPAEAEARSSALRRSGKRKLTGQLGGKKKSARHNIGIEGEPSVVDEGIIEEVGRILDNRNVSSASANEPEICHDTSNVSTSVGRRGKKKAVMSELQSSLSDSKSGSAENSSLVDAADDGCTGQHTEPDNERNLQARNSLTPNEGQQKRGRGRNLKVNKGWRLSLSCIFRNFRASFWSIYCRFVATIDQSNYGPMFASTLERVTE